MGAPKRRSLTQMQERMDRALENLTPRDCAALIIYHQPDDGADLGMPGAMNAIRWRGFGGPLEGRAFVIKYLREIADSIEKEGMH